MYEPYMPAVSEDSQKGRAQALRRIIAHAACCGAPDIELLVSTYFPTEYRAAKAAECRSIRYISIR